MCYKKESVQVIILFFTSALDVGNRVRFLHDIVVLLTVTVHCRNTIPTCRCLHHCLLDCCFPYTTMTPSHMMTRHLVRRRQQCHGRVVQRGHRITCCQSHMACELVPVSQRSVNDFRNWTRSRNVMSTSSNTLWYNFTF